jgi:hypothetical protein
MVKELAERRTRARPPSLLSINGIQCLIHERAEAGIEVHPLGYELRETCVVVHVCHCATDVYYQSHQRNQVRRHALYTYFWTCSYQGDELDKELPPVVHDFVHERVATRDVLVLVQCLQSFFGNITHICLIMIKIISGD